MVDLDRHKRILIPVLAILVILVWGHTGLRVMNRLGENQDTMPAPDLTPGNQWQGFDSTWFDWHYPATLRDPFSLTRIRHTPNPDKPAGPNSQASQPMPPEPVRPNLRYCGMVGTPGNRVAIIEIPNHQTLKVRPGDKIDSLIIHDVQEKRIFIRAGNRMWEYGVTE
jgi:hypothetical protein